MKEFLVIYNTKIGGFPREIKKIKANNEDEAYDTFNDWLENNTDRTDCDEYIDIISMDELNELEIIEK